MCTRLAPPDAADIATAMLALDDQTADVQEADAQDVRGHAQEAHDQEAHDRPADDSRAAYDGRAAYVVPLCAKPWPPTLADAVLARLGHPVVDTRRHALSALAAEAAAGLDPALAPRTRALAEGYRERCPDDAQASVLDRLAEVLTFRHEMHQEFA